MPGPTALVSHVMKNKALDMAMTKTANILGIESDTVKRIVQIGIPVIAFMANDDHKLLHALFGRSTKEEPEPLERFYDKLARDPKEQQGLVHQFKTLMGSKSDEVDKETAKGAGVTADVAGKVLSLTNPALMQALGEENETKDEKGFGNLITKLAG